MALDVSHLLIALVAGSAGALWMRGRRRRDTDRDAPSHVPTVRRMDETDAGTRPSLGARIFLSMFLTGWLIGWTAAIVTVFAVFLGTAALGGTYWVVAVFLLGWLIAAVAGWFGAVNALIALVRGRTPMLAQLQEHG